MLPKDILPKERMVRLLLYILANPYRYTRKDLATYCQMSKDTIDDYFDSFKNIPELRLDHDNHWRYALLPDQHFRELQYLQSFTEEEHGRIHRLINQYLSERDALYLSKKLGSLYDFQKLGIRALRRPALERIDQLEAAKRQKRIVILENYRSNSSNAIRNRIVEPFHIDVELDTLQAYDHDRKDSMHFRLSRAERVRLTQDAWQYESKHQYKYTDVFRIANNEQVYVHLRLNVFACNILREYYPKAEAYIQPSAELGFFDFECKVNVGYLGLSNFLMGYGHSVTIIAPDSLKVHIANQAQAIRDKNQ